MILLQMGGAGWSPWRDSNMVALPRGWVLEGALCYKAKIFNPVESLQVIMRWGATMKPSCTTQRLTTYLTAKGLKELSNLKRGFLLQKEKYCKLAVDQLLPAVCNLGDSIQKLNTLKMPLPPVSSPPTAGKIKSY